MILSSVAIAAAGGATICRAAARRSRATFMRRSGSYRLRARGQGASDHRRKAPMFPRASAGPRFEAPSAKRQVASDGRMGAAAPTDPHPRRRTCANLGYSLAWGGDGSRSGKAMTSTGRSRGSTPPSAMATGLSGNPLTFLAAVARAAIRALTGPPCSTSATLRRPAAGYADAVLKACGRNAADAQGR